MSDNNSGGLGVLVIGLIIIGVIVGCKFLGGVPVTYSEGTRTGIPTKVSYKGIVCKTYEGQLNLGGVKDTSEGVVANVWEFSVLDRGIVEQINVAANNRESVTLHYTQVYISATCKGASGYYITKVEKTEKGGGKK